MINSLRVFLLLIAAMYLAGAHAAEDSTLPALEQPFPAVDFTTRGEDGETYRLSDYRGKLVIINFWATWCPPCREEMPSLERLWQKMQHRDMVILAINVGEDADTIFEFTGSYPVSFPLLLDRQGRIIERYPVRGLPTTYIVNADGMVTHRAVGGRDWDHDTVIQQLESLLPE